MSQPAATQPPPASTRPRARAWLAALASLGLLICVATLFDLRAMRSAFADAKLWRIAAAVLLQPLIIGLMAWRWAFVAGRLGLALPWATALREYWSSVFLNQTLPLGVAGDLARTARHAHMHRQPQGRAWARALLAAAIDRAGGQLVLWALAALVLPLMLGELLDVELPVPGVLVGSAIVLLGLALAGRLAWHRARPDTRKAIASALWQPRALFVHLAAGLGTIALHLGTLALCGSALGVELTAMQWLAATLGILALTSVPWFFAGWGVRELGLAGIFVALGPGGEIGVATSLAFGVVALLSSLPGAWFVTRSPVAQA